MEKNGDTVTVSTDGDTVTVSTEKRSLIASEEYQALAQQIARLDNRLTAWMDNRSGAVGATKTYWDARLGAIERQIQESQQVITSHHLGQLRNVDNRLGAIELALAERLNEEGAACNEEKREAERLRIREVELKLGEVIDRALQATTDRIAMKERLATIEKAIVDGVQIGKDRLRLMEDHARRLDTIEAGILAARQANMQAHGDHIQRTRAQTDELQAAIKATANYDGLSAIWKALEDLRKKPAELLATVRATQGQPAPPPTRWRRVFNYLFT